MLIDYSLYEGLESKLTKLLSKKEKVLYILKGFAESSFKDYQIKKLYNIDLFNGDDYDFKDKIAESVARLSQDGPYMLSYEEYLVGQKYLSDIYAAYKYQLIVIENNLFINYYPLSDEFDPDEVNNILENEPENYYSLFYDELLMIDGKPFISYKPIETDASIEYIEYFDINKNYRYSESAQSVNEEISFGNCDETILSTTMYLLNSNNRDFNIIKEKTLSSRVDRIACILDSFGYRFYQVDKEIKYTLPDRIGEYETILKRNNPNYSFFDIDFYSNPGVSLDTIKINQSVIIDSIVENSLKAKNDEAYNDIFVTAPTGSGKSILFQIPAIYLGENRNLFTIVISPLIGLMEDQIINIKKMSSKAATINSDYTPQEKEIIKEKIKLNDIDILYVSPETLLSNWDIKSIIGDRDIGLMVVDESHIVSTWGKSFRPDYWFLGSYLSSLRSKGDYKFPIATFSATVTYGGLDDMHSDIIESLKMRTGNYEFIAPMRRDDIAFDIKYFKDSPDYLKEKNDLVVKDLNELVNAKTKTVAYFPFIRQVSNYASYIDDKPQVSIYHGQLDKTTKQSCMNDFANNTTCMMLATKAFGMGIDINDIQTIYHYAPTGNLCDYVQEIGRAARRKDIKGIAKLEFFENDFRHIKRLYGMSAIRDVHIVETLKKIKALYEKNKRRNFIVSSDEFSYIFTSSGNEDTDSKLKTVMLMIQKDFERNNRINFKPLIFKPRAMFTKGYVMIKQEDFDILQSDYQKHLKYFKLYLDKDKSKEDNSITLMGNIFVVDYKSMWEDLYNDIPFGMFKHDFLSGNLIDFDISGNFIPEYLLDVISNTELGDACDKTINILKEFLQKMSLFPEGKHISVEDIAQMLKEIKMLNLKGNESNIVAINLINIINNYKSGNSFHTQYVFKALENTGKYTIVSFAKLLNRINEMQKGINNKFFSARNNKKRTFLINTKTGKVSESEEMLLAQLLELFRVAEYEVISGDVPEYFIRVNSIVAIEGIINKHNYKSEMVQIVKRRHEESIKIMRYFFTKLKTDKERWDYIEKYFAGFDYEVAEIE